MFPSRDTRNDQNIVGSSSLRSTQSIHDIGEDTNANYHSFFAPNSPLSRLPSELLLKIFTAYIALHHKKAASSQIFISSSYRLIRNPYRWISGVSHVCHHWRSVAIGFPALWTYIDLTAKKEYIQTMLSRSNGCPLTVWLEDDGYYESWGHLPVLKMVLREMHRIQVLRMECSSVHENYVSITNLTSAPAPRLRSLTLEGPSSLWELQHPSMPLPVLHTDLPSLRTVNLTHHPFHLARAFIRPSITKFISRYPGRTDSPLTIVDVFECIRVMPLLEVLRLEESFVARHTSRHYNSLSLPNLRSLKICGSATACAWFLDHLNHPYLDDINISCATEDSFSEDSQLSTLVSKMASSLVAPGSQPSPLCFHFTFNSHGQSTIAGFTSTPPIGMLLIDPILQDILLFKKTPFMSLSIPPAFVSGTLRVLNSHVSLSSVQVLSFSISNHGSLPDIPDIAGCVQAMTAVHTLVVRGWNANELVSILTPIPSRSTSQVNLPCLEKICAADICFGMEEIWLQSFIHSLEVRRDVLGKTITLCLTETKLTSQGIDALRSVAKELHMLA